jgi:MmyB-like transcription regulator ligand binding domain
MGGMADKNRELADFLRRARSQCDPSRAGLPADGRTRREVQARAAVESLRLEAGNDPDDRATAELISELRTRRAEFVQWWDEHRVYQRTHGSKRLRHPIVGDLTVEYETLTLPGDPNTTLFVYTTEPNSPSRRAMSVLASWSLTGAEG